MRLEQTDLWEGFVLGAERGTVTGREEQAGRGTPEEGPQYTPLIVTLMEEQSNPGLLGSRLHTTMTEERIIGCQAPPCS